MHRHVTALLAFAGALALGASCGSVTSSRMDTDAGAGGHADSGAVGVGGSGVGGAPGTGGSITGAGGAGTGGAMTGAGGAGTGGATTGAGGAGTGGATTGTGGATPGTGGKPGTGGAPGTGGTPGTGGAIVREVPLLLYELESSGANTGTLSGYAIALAGPVTYGTGKVGRAATFGSGAYGLVSGARVVFGAYPQYTISMWINATAPAASTSFFSINNRSAAPYGGIQLGYSSTTMMSICASTTSSSYLTGSCPIFAAPALNGWHNLIVRYAGTGIGAGQGANVEVYIDDVLTLTVPNDAANNPVFNAGVPDSLAIGAAGAAYDDVRIYNRTFTVAEQCTQVIGGTYAGTTCTLPP